ncbi:MAG: InlB B-repeat-containing protein, partial [Clostridia bacterium]|nr:InlB B-repeat-containing protein [Clostridia bacterium]
AAEGYEFKGWKVGTETKESGKITLTASITITAQWDAIEYTVTIDLGDYAADGVAESEAYKDIKAKYDTEINVPADPEGAAGWTFTNWKVGTTTTTVKAPATLKIKGDVTLTAQWASTQNSWKVTFKTDDNTTYATQTVAKDAEGANKKVSLPTTNPKKDGYRFLNWYIPGEDGDVDIDPENLPDVEDNMTIVAKWQAVFTVTVLDDLNGNAVTGATTEYDNNGSEGTPEKFNLPADLTEEGLTFKGWFLVVDNEGTKEYGTQVTADTDVTANVTIAAKWAITVTYELGENHVTDATAPEAEEVEKHVGKVTLPDAPAAATDHKFLGWKVGDDTELKAAGVEIDVTEHVTVTAQYGAWIVVGTDGTKGGVAWTGYRSNVENTPQWVGTLARGEKLVLKGIQKSQGINIWDGLIYSVFNGATLKGQQNVCFNHPNMDGAGEGDLVPIRSTVVDQAGAEINDATDYADRIKELNADCDITITWDWSIATNSIFLTIQYKKGEKSAEVVYGYSAPAEGTLADSYKVGLDVDCGYAEITSIEKTTVAEADLIDTVLTIGTAGNTYFYTHTTPLYSEKLQKGAKVVFTGEMTSPGTGNFQTLGALIYGAECKGYFRMDNWINDGDAIKAAENWNIVLSDAPVWDSFLGAIKDCTITLTFDWTNENEIVIFFDLTSHAEDHTRQTMKYTITATEGNTLLNEYTIGLGTDHAFTAITSIVRTPAENAD